MNHARSLIEQADRLTAEVRSLKGTPVGTVIVGMPPSVCMILVEPLFNRIRTELPGVKLRISEAFSGDLDEWLSSGRLDAAVIYRSGRSHNIIGQELLIEDMFLVSRPKERRSGHKKHVTLAEASAMPLILPGRPHGLRLLIDSACSEKGLALNVALELDAMATIKELVEAGDACTILPYGGVHNEVEAGRLCAARIMDPSIARTLILAQSSRRTRTPATDAVVQRIRSEVKKLIDDEKWTGPA